MPSRSRVRFSITAVLVLGLLGFSSSGVQATFSIVAVDLKTGEVGSAGASCVPNVAIISDILPGIGAIHTQAAYLTGNQINARDRMLLGDTPAEIMSWLSRNDISGRPASRQYGAVTLRNRGQSASFTGSQNGDWAGHLTGPTYAIQGNILSGARIVRDMERAYLASEGLPLADRLMAAMFAAKQPGADVRCFPKSSQSAYLRLARPGDEKESFHLRLWANGQGNRDPIVNLNRKFEDWKETSLDKVDAIESLVYVESATLPADGNSSTYIVVTPRNNSRLRVPLRRIRILQSGNGTLSPPFLIEDGSNHKRYVFSVRAPQRESIDEIRIFGHSGHGWVEILPPVVLRYRELRRF